MVVPQRNGAYLRNRTDKGLVFLQIFLSQYVLFDQIIYYLTYLNHGFRSTPIQRRFENRVEYLHKRGADHW
ncbi:hypothetical protein EMIT0P260_150072 [Pseudomonas sp. IT-P260]